MGKIMTITFIIAFAATTVYASTLGFSNNMGIKHKILENNLSLEKISDKRFYSLNQGGNENLEDLYGYKTKSPFKAFMFSLAVPGLGEYYLGHKIKAVSFFGADVIFWTGYFIYRGKGRDRENEYKNYADIHYSPEDYLLWWDAQPDDIKAGYSHTLPVDNNGNPVRNREYYENIGKYHQFQVGWDDIGLNYPPSPEGGYVSPHRTFYLNLRKQSNDYFTTASTIAMVSIANHIISAFDAAIGAKKFNRGARQYSLKFKAKKYEGKMTPFLEFTARF